MNRFLSLSLLFIAMACHQEKRLPIMGPRQYDVKIINGEEHTDTIYTTIPDFEFINQDGNSFTPEDLKGKIYVADFFFTTCPSICPIMKTQMLRIHEKYKGNDEIHIVSHSIDPTHDTVEVLRDYADRLEINTNYWTFLTGDMDSIFNVAQKGYLVSAKPDSLAPGGLLHSGAFILVDKEKRIRGYYDGTIEKDVDQLMKDMDILLSEYDGA
ncbi:SCO family protein [Hyphobacterium sp. CCMP332]|nr:SCO family protein [Hyphobacterium sp. CCMP332]